MHNIFVQILGAGVWQQGRGKGVGSDVGSGVWSGEQGFVTEEKVKFNFQFCNFKFSGFI